MVLIKTNHSPGATAIHPGAMTTKYTYW